ncbi:MAG: dTDP-4-dehydrorhamnose 3,5-epimerase [Pseudanabaenaceae cyanobacterium]
MKAVETALAGAYILEPTVWSDSRGYFFESYNRRTFREATGQDPEFVQDNHSRSHQNVLRGLHYQIQQPQGKLVRVVSGEVLDVAVDLRRSSPTFGQWTSVLLSAENHRLFWIPPGFAHGFIVRSPVAEFLYKTTDYYAPAHERCLQWNDPQLQIDWQCETPILSAKDRQGLPLTQAELFP